MSDPVNDNREAVSDAEMREVERLRGVISQALDGCEIWMGMSALMSELARVHVLTKGPFCDVEKTTEHLGRYILIESARVKL